MKGHENIIQIRLDGFKPKAIWFYLRDYPKFAYHWDSFAEGYDTPEVFVADADHIKTLDLRFVFGLPVHIIGGDEVRAKELLQALKAAKAKHVYTIFENILLGASHESAIA